MSHIVTILFLIAWMINTGSAYCIYQYEEKGDINVKLAFHYTWTNETRKVLCYRDKQLIGECYHVFAAACTIFKTQSYGLYNLSAIENLTSVFITIITFNETTTGDYICKKEKNSQNKPICIQNAVNLSSLTLDPHSSESASYPVRNVQSNFSCITSMSRPAAIIQWFVGGRNITDKAMYVYNSSNAISILQYTPVSSKTETLTCVSHYVFRSTSITLKTDTNMLVQYAVTKPVISTNTINASDTVIVREDRSVELICSSNSFPLPKYQWFYPGGTSNNATVTVNLNRTANGGNMSCRATNMFYSLNGTMTTEINTAETLLKLSVTYPPLNVLFRNGYNGELAIESKIRVVIGDSLSIVCESDANPSATTFWQGQLPNSNTLTVSDVHIDTNWTCEAFNIIESVREKVTKTLTTIVLYGPNIPIIKYSILPDESATGLVTNNETITLIEGSSLQLKCATLSFPSSTYSWGNGLEGDIHTISNVSRRTNMSYTCMANNTMETTFKGTITGKNMSTLHLNLLYGPHNLSALFNNSSEIQGVLRVIRGWSFTISCNVNSRPSSKISWHGFPLEEKENYLIVNNVTIEISKNITCTATNTMIDSLGHSVSKSLNMTFAIDVLHPPVAQAIDNTKILRYANLTVACNLSNYGNPTATNFTWTKLDHFAFLQTGKTLVLNRAELSDEGVYQCHVTNKMEAIGKTIEYGSTKSNFFLDVQYEATVKRFYANSSNTSTIIVGQNQSVELICEVDGDPKPLVYIINATDLNNATMDGSLTAYQTFSSHIQRARCEYDTGVYKCQTRNTYNTKEQERILTLIVQCSPRASPFSPSETTLHRAPNDTAVLSFTIKAYPEPTVTNYSWSKKNNNNNMWELLSNDSQYTIFVSEDRLQTELTLNNVNVNDFGSYQVKVSTILGSTSEVFTLHAKAKPEKLQEVHVVRRGNTEIELEWIPGFDGGEQQTFIINYTVTNLESWNAIRVPTNRTTHTLRGLKPETTYKVKMRAENIIGNSSWTEFIQMSTLAEIEQKGSVSKAVGGILGGLSVILIIVAAFIFWRRRNTDRKDPISQKMLPKRSVTKKPETTTYENIGMLTPNSNNYNMTRPSHKDRKQPTKHIQAANTVIQIKNKSHTGAMKHTDRMDLTQTPDPHRKASVGDIRRSRKADIDAIVQPHGQNSFVLEQDPIYDNIEKKQNQFRSRDIAIQNLQEAVVKAKADSTEVFTEFSALHVASESISYSTDTALKSANTSKNRYKNMYPYDKNRVKLPVVGNDIDTDFINASFIDGYSSPKKYIAAQGPLASTRADFWSMIWEQNVGVVAMVTNLVEDSKRKCFQYWPTSPENDCQYSDYTIRLLSEETYANFVVRTLHCTKKGSIKVQTVNHLHFTAWPDKDVPDTALSLMQFWRKVRNVEKPDGAPWIVHCSAGVGRTGTFIAVDYLYDQGISEKQINVFDAVLLLRRQRINMVQTKNQYLYLHEVVCEALCTVGKVLTNTAFMDTPRTSESLNQEYQHICESHIPDREEAGADGEYTLVLDGEKPDNLNKNADQCVVPDDRYRPVLNMTFTTLGHNDYINAVYISTFGGKDRLILTQSARVSSEIDFVRLLHDHSLRTVVTFSDEVEPYMPASSDSCLIGPFTATTKSDTQKHVYQESVVQFKYIAEYEGFDVRIIRFTKWSNTLDVCNIKDLLSLLISVQESACKRPVVLQCRDGYSQSGLFAVLWCLVERCKQDGEVAVAETVRMIRRRRNQVITNETQYRFCHQFMKEYIEGCQVYANT